MCDCPLYALIGDLACNPGMCPDWESNWKPFGSQASTQSTEPHQPGPIHYFYFKVSGTINLLMINLEKSNQTMMFLCFLLELMLIISTNSCWSKAQIVATHIHTHKWFRFLFPHWLQGSLKPNFWTIYIVLLGVPFSSNRMLDSK